MNLDNLLANYEDLQKAKRSYLRVRDSFVSFLATEEKDVLDIYPRTEWVGKPCVHFKDWLTLPSNVETYESPLITSRVTHELHSVLMLDRESTLEFLDCFFDFAGLDRDVFDEFFKGSAFIFEMFTETDRLEEKIFLNSTLTVIQIED